MVMVLVSRVEPKQLAFELAAVHSLFLEVKLPFLSI